MQDAIQKSEPKKSPFLNQKNRQEDRKPDQREIDGDIIALYFARNEEAIRMTQERYGRLCRSVIGHVLRDDCDAEECVNDTYLTLWNTIPPERPHNLAGFLTRVARNIAFDRLKYNSADKRVPSALLLSLTELDETLPDPDNTEIGEAALGKLISEFLKGEKKSVRQVFVRRYYFHDSLEEIAARYSYSLPKVKSMLYHTRNKLKKFLTERGVYI